MPRDRIIKTLAIIGQALAKLPEARDDDAMHELAEQIAAVTSVKFGPNERRLMFVSALMAAEPVDQEFVGWVLGVDQPLTDSKYPYWKLFLARENDIEEDRAVFRQSEVTA